MVTKYLNIGDNDWGVLVCYDYSIIDYDDMWAIMRSFGITTKKADEALRVLSGTNTGMTISNFELRMSVIFVSHASSISEWWSTFNHELWHVTTAIIDYYNEAYDNEPAAYTHGELMRLAVKEIGEPCDCYS